MFSVSRLYYRTYQKKLLDASASVSMLASRRIIFGKRLLGVEGQAKLSNSQLIIRDSIKTKKCLIAVSTKQ